MRVAENHHSDWKAAGLERLIGPALLFLIVVLFYWKLVLTNQFTWLASPDLSNMILPWFQLQAGEWHAHRFPLWDPNSWGGQPLFGQAQPGAAYPLNWLLFLAPLKQGWIRQAALHWYFVLIHYLASLACYALCRDLSRSVGASIVAGCVFALGGYVATTDWPQMLNGAIWAPLVFLYLFRAERGERPLASSLLSGFFLGVAWLAGHHQMQIFLSLAVAGTWLWICVRLCMRQGRPDWKLAKLAAFSMGLALMASAFQTIPTAEYGRRAVRWTGAEEPQHFNETVPYKVHEEYALKPIALLGIFVPQVEQRSNPYVGVVAFALALLGAILAWRERQVRWLATIGLAGIVFALGPNSLLHGILYAVVPLVEKARVPGAATFVFALGLAPLVAFGIDRVALPESSAWSRRVGVTLAWLSAALALASLLFFAAKVQVTISDDRMMITALSAALFAALLAGWRGGHISARAGTAAVLALVLFELANVTTYWLPRYGQFAERDAFLRRLSEHSDLALFVRARGEPARIEYDDHQIPYNIGDWYGIEAFNAYAASVTENIWQHDVFSPKVKDFLGIRYYFGKAPQQPGQRQVFQGQSGMKVFENPGAFPRVWSVHQSQTVSDPRQARGTLASPGFNARTQVFFTGEPGPGLSDCDGSDEVAMTTHQPNRVVIQAGMKCRGMVILTDTWFPGWRATVDGRSAKIEQAYGAVRGVVVEAGEHIIEMRYRPWSVLLGAAMSLAAAAIVVIILLTHEHN